MASFLTRKGWGYHEDQMITTDPIRGPVPNTSVADSIFDESAVAVGDRAGVANLIDLRTKKIRVSWSAHNAKTHLSKPRGIVNIFE